MEDNDFETRPKNCRKYRKKVFYPLISCRNEEEWKEMSSIMQYSLSKKVCVSKS